MVIGHIYRRPKSGFVRLLVELRQTIKMPVPMLSG